MRKRQKYLQTFSNLKKLKLFSYLQHKFETQKSLITLASALLLLLATGCASSSYVLSSNPAGVNVYYLDAKSQQKQLLGATPVEYKKSALPKDEAFVLKFEKDGFFPQDVPIAPTDDMRTTVSVTMKSDPALAKQPNFELNQLVLRLFKAQEMIYKKRYQAAIIEIDQLLRDKPDLVQAHVMKGTSYYLLNEMPSALQAWKKALEIDPGNKELLKFLADRNITIK